jgi:undecaprenyl-diphosphatase
MALAIEETPPQQEWSTKKCISLAIISLVVGAVIFAFAYIGMHQHTGIGALNQPVLSWIIKHRQPRVTDIMRFITTAASPLILIAFACVSATVWAIFNREIWRPLLLISATGVAAIASTALKVITSNGRPPQIDMIKPLETDYSFPSGHTISVVVFLLVISYLICSRRPSSFRIFFWAIITAIGIGIITTSRLYLGYHWLTDVTASIGLGFVILSVAIIIDRFVISRIDS